MQQIQAELQFPDKIITWSAPQDYQLNSGVELEPELEPEQNVKLFRGPGCEFQVIHGSGSDSGCYFSVQNPMAMAPDPYFHLEFW